MGFIGVRYWLRGSARLRGVCVRSMIPNTAVSKYILNRDGRPCLMDCVDRDKPAETDVVATVTVAVRFSLATNVCITPNTEAVFCFQGGNRQARENFASSLGRRAG